MHHHIKSRLIRIAGEKYVYDHPSLLELYTRDASPLEGYLPELVIVPGNEQEIVAIVKLANEEGIPLYPRNLGSNLWGGAIPIAGGIVLDLRRLNKIKHIDEELFSCTAETGVTMAQLNDALTARGFYNLVAPEGGACSCIGGSFLGHGDGIGSGLWGTQGDAVIGCRVVLPTGEVVVTGSGTNPKAAERAGGSGQFFRYAFGHDLTGLFAGSEGTLGILLEVTTRIEKLPEKYGFVSLAFSRTEDACDLLYQARIQRIPLNFAALRERASLEALRPGTAHPEAQLICILEGDRFIVDYGTKTLLELARQHNGWEGDHNASLHFWNKRFSLVPGSMYKLGSRVLLPLHYPLGRLAWFYPRIRRVCEEIIKQKFNFAYFIGGFQINTVFVCYPVILFLEQYPAQYKKVTECSREVKEALIDLGGSPIQIGRLWWEAMGQLGDHFALIGKIKKAVDPNNIMVPGMMGLSAGREKDFATPLCRPGAEWEDDFGVSPLPYCPPSQLPVPRWFENHPLRKLGYDEKLNAAFRCQRCGACLSTENCQAMSANPYEEAFTPRGRMIILRKLLEGRLKIEDLAPSLKEAIRRCTLCGRCNTYCFANVAHREGLSSEQNINHREVFAALKCLLGLKEAAAPAKNLQ
ncbi:MAG TPA: hypothetical protein DCQ14_01935 [Firmicutes bacterium]|nr:hypothetical protein [Bacillota bacterium]